MPWAWAVRQGGGSPPLLSLRQPGTADLQSRGHQGAAGAGALPVPPHGMEGEGHICFRASAEEIDVWRARLEGRGSASRRLRVARRRGLHLLRDPAGNCLEFCRAADMEAQMTRRLDRGNAAGGASHNPRQGAGDPRAWWPVWAERGSRRRSWACRSPRDRPTFAANAELKAWRRRGRGPAGARRRFRDRGRGLGGRPASIRRAGRVRPRTSRSPCAGWPTSCAPRCLEASPGPRANFTAALCLAWPDGEMASSRARFAAISCGRRAEQGFRL
jgi:hypothetical protein